MTIYCDASLIVAAITAEAGSRESRHWLAGRSDLAISEWVSTEVAAAIGMKLRSGSITAAERLRVEAGWRAMRVSGFTLLALASTDFADAERLVDAGRGLRAGDALHLSVALRHRCELVTRDRALAEAATASGMTTTLLTRIDSR